MPHLSIEYSANLEDQVDMQAFCVLMRDAMVEAGIFPLGGIRVRAFPARHWVIADGDATLGFVHMICRVGSGRDEATRLAAAEVLYAAAEKYLGAHLSDPLALSLDLDELHPVTSLKRFNTVHAHVKAKTE